MEKTKTQKKDETVEFVRLCNNYCQVLEKADKMPMHELFDNVSQSLMAVYQQTFLVTRFKTRYESDPQKFLAEKQYNKIRGSLMGLLGRRDVYHEVLDPNRPGSSNIFQASLSEDLTDIYQDLYDFVHWYSEGTFESINDSVIECITNFEKYWGIKLMNALRALHVLRYLKKDGTIFSDPSIEEDEEVGDSLGNGDDDEPDSEPTDEFMKEV
jgi:hypothetical protein